MGWENTFITWNKTFQRYLHIAEAKLFVFLECLSIDPNGRLVIAKMKLGDEDFFSSFCLCSM